jgi:hypothetical protein
VAKRPQHVHYHFHGIAPKDALGTSEDDPIDESDRAVYAGAGSNEADEVANAEDEYCSGGSPKRRGRKRKTGGQVDDMPVRGNPESNVAIGRRGYLQVHSQALAN